MRAVLHRALVAAALFGMPVITAACTAQTAAPAAQQAVPADLQASWAGFRAAALAGDAPAMARMTRFPLEVAGELDDTPVRRVGQDRFPATIRQVLDADSGLSIRESLSNREYLRRTDRLVPDARNPIVMGTEARVGAFVFRRDAGMWKLSRVYSEGD